MFPSSNRWSHWSWHWTIALFLVPKSLGLPPQTSTRPRKKISDMGRRTHESSKSGGSHWSLPGRNTYIVCFCFCFCFGGGGGVFFLFVLRKAGNLDFYVKFSDFFPKFGKCESRSQIFWWKHKIQAIDPVEDSTEEIHEDVSRFIAPPATEVTPAATEGRFSYHPVCNSSRGHS